MSKVSAAPRCTPPRPPVAKTRMPGPVGQRRGRGDRRRAGPAEGHGDAEVTGAQLEDVVLQAQPVQLVRRTARPGRRRPARRPSPAPHHRRGPPPRSRRPPVGCHLGAARGRGSCSPAPRPRSPSASAPGPPPRRRRTRGPSDDMRGSVLIGRVALPTDMDPLLPVLHAAVDELEPRARRPASGPPRAPRARPPRDPDQPHRRRPAEPPPGSPPTLLDGSGVVADLGAARTGIPGRAARRPRRPPVPERTGLPWASTTDGVAHACGHDLHTTVVLGAGLALATQSRGARVGRHRRAADLPARRGGHPRWRPRDHRRRLADGRRRGVRPAQRPEPRRRRGRPAGRPHHGRLRQRRGHPQGPRRPHLASPPDRRTSPSPWPRSSPRSRPPSAAGVDPRAGAALVWGSVHAGGGPERHPLGRHRQPARCGCSTPPSGRRSGPSSRSWSRPSSRPYAVTAELRYTQGVPPVVNGSTLGRLAPRRRPGRRSGARNDRAVARRRGLRVVPHRGARAPWAGSARVRREAPRTTCTRATSSSTSARSDSGQRCWWGRCLDAATRATRRRCSTFRLGNVPHRLKHFRPGGPHDGSIFLHRTRRTACPFAPKPQKEFPSCVR